MNFDIVNLITIVVIVFASMVLHELMHGLTAHWLGDDTAKDDGRLTLNPIKHIDPFLTILLPLILAVTGGPIFGGAKPVPFRPDKVKGGEWGAALVGIVGPLTNLVLALLCFTIAFFSGSMIISGGGIYFATGILPQILMTGVMVNLGFFAFNILPIPPLDGSRVLYAIAPEPVRRAMSFIENAGLLVIFVIVLVLSQPLGILLSAIIDAVLKGFTVIFGLF